MPGRRMGHGGGHMPGERAKDFKGTIRKLIKYLRNYKVALIRTYHQKFLKL